MDDSYKVWADVAKNRLYIVLKGRIPDDVAKAAADTVIDEAGKLRPGFSIINDCSLMEPGSPQGVKEIRRAQAFLAYCGVKRIIRVVRPEHEAAARQFEKTPKEYPFANTAASVEEAERILDL